MGKPPSGGGSTAVAGSAHRRAGGGVGSHHPQRPLRLVELQDILNSDHEEKLVQGLHRAGLQFLREHGYRRPKPPTEGGQAEEEEEDDGEVSDDELEWPAADEGEGADAHEEGDEEDEDEEEEEEEEDEDDAGEGEEEEDDEESGDKADEDVEGEAEAVEGQPAQGASHTAAGAAEAPAGPRREVKGLLAEYLASSPQVVELFQLWDLEQRQASRKVAEKHTFLHAAVLRCLHGTVHAQTGAGALLSRRLLHERGTELHAQLISSNQGLATATLRLLKALVRLGPGPAWEVVSRFSLTAKPVLHLFAPSSPASRPVAVALAAALVRCPDPSMVVRLLSTDRVLKAVFKSLLSDRSRTVEAWLAALACALRHPRVPAKSKRRLVTSYRLEQLRRLLLPGGGGGEGGKGPVRRGPPVQRELVCRLIHALLGGRDGTGESAAAGGGWRVKGARGVMAVVRLLLALSGSDDGRQQQLALEILESHPEVAAPFMRRFNQMWEARPTFTGLASYLFLARLLRAEPPTAAALFALEDEGFQLAQQRRRGAPGEGTAAGTSSSAGGEGAIERVLGGLLPSGLGKRELTKAILGQNPLLQRMGLLLITHVLQRAQAAIAQAPPATARALRLALPHRLPDLQAVLAVRSRCAPASGAAPAWGNQMLALVLRVLRAYQTVVPEAMQAFRFDFLRLLPDSEGGLVALPGFVQWELLRLLEALGPDRLQWLPPDAQAWSSSNSTGAAAGGGAGPSAFQQVLGLLGRTRDGRLYALARRLLVGVIQSKVGGVDAALGDAILDAWDGSSPEAAALLEGALRLAANRPYPFSLMVLRLLPESSSPPSPVLVALLLLVTRRAFSPEEEEALRGELHVFGLSWDALKGRFAASPAALSYARAVLRAQRAASASVEELDACVRLLLLDAPEGGKRGKGKGKGKSKGKAAAAEGDVVVAGLREALARYREAAGSPSSEPALWEVEQALARVPLSWVLSKKSGGESLFHELVAGLSAEGGTGLLTLAGYLGRHAVAASVFDALAAAGKGGEKTLALLPRALPLPVLLAHHAAATTPKGRKAGERVLSQHLHRCGTSESLAGACRALLGASQDKVLAGAQQASLLRILARGATRWVLGSGDDGVLAQELQQSLSSPFSGWTSHAWLGVAALLRALGPDASQRVLDCQQQQEDTCRALGWGLLFQQAPSGALLQQLCSDTTGDAALSANPALLHVCLRELLVTAPAVVEGLDVDARLRVASPLLAGEDDSAGGMAGLLLRLAAPGEGHAPSIVPELAARGDLVVRCWAGLCEGDEEPEEAAAFALLLGRCVQEVEAARGFLFEQLGRWAKTGKAGSRQPAPLLLAPALAVLAARAPADDAQRALLLQSTDALGAAVLSPGSWAPVDPRLEAWALTSLRRLLRCLGDGQAGERQLLPVVEGWQGLLSAALADAGAVRVSLVTALVQWMVGPASPLPATEKARVAVGLVATACGALERISQEEQGEEEAAGAWLACVNQLAHDAHSGPILREALAGEGAMKKHPLSAALQGLSLATARRLEWTPLVASTTELLACVLPLAGAEQQQQPPLVAAALEGFYEGGEDGQARLLRALEGEGREAVLRLLLLLVARVGPGADDDEDNGVAQHGRRLMPTLLATYRASMAPADQLTLRLLWKLAAGGLRLGLTWFRLGASAEEVDHAMEYGRFPNRMDGGGGGAEAAAWLLEWVDPERIFASLETFPLHRPLFPPAIEAWEGRCGPEEGEEGFEESTPAAGASSAAAAASVYDPAFLLALLDGLLRHQGVSIRALVDSCLLPYCLVALASARRAVRACAYSCLHSVLQLLERAPKNDPAAKERPQLLLLLDVVRGSISEPCARLPCTHALFVARAAVVLSRPANDLYVALNGFLVRRQSLDLGDVPLFLPLFYSSRTFHKRERVWALRLLRDALRTEQDLSLLHRRHGLALLLAFLDAALHRPTGGGVPADSLVISVGMEVLSATASLPRGPALLLRQGGLLAWAGGAVAAALQQVQGAGEPYQRKSIAGGALPKRTVGTLQPIVALTIRALQGFTAAAPAPPQQQHGDKPEEGGSQQHQQHQHHTPQQSTGVVDQGRALVPLLLLLLHKGLLPPARPQRAGIAAPVPARHAPAAVLALGGAVLDLLLLLQQPETGLLSSGLGLGLPQARALIEAVGAIAAPASVREGLARQVLALVVREAAATENLGVGAGGEQEKDPEAVASLVRWVAEQTAGLLHYQAPSEEALATSAGAGRLALRLLRGQPEAVARLSGAAPAPRRFWPWALVSLLSCPAFLPGSLGDSGGHGAGTARVGAKNAWVELALHLLQAQGGQEEGAFLRDLSTALEASEKEEEVVIDVVGAAVRGLLGGAEEEALRRETRAALAPFVSLPASPASPGKKKRPPTTASAVATEERGGSGARGKKQKRSKT